MTDLFGRVQAALGDSFRIEAEMPAGGMSRIFLATEVSLNRQVIVKVLPPELTSEVSSARFRQEAEMLARLQHPHILPILSTGSHADVLYYVTPFIAGESVRHRLESSGPLPVEDAIRIIAEVADALSYAHSAGVLHRDIKPENILLEGRHAILADFGVARALEQSSTGGRLTATGMSIGTPGYMSPEQVAGDQVDGRADLYALAVVGYEMLTGQPPFAGPSAQMVLAAHLTTPPPPIGELRPEVSAHVGSAIARALAKAPEDRFQAAAAFRDAIEGRGAVVGLDPAAKRRRLAVGVLGALLVALLAWWTVSRLESRVDPAILGALRVAADSGLVDQFATLLDESNLALDHSAIRELAGPFTGSLRTEVAPEAGLLEIVRVQPINSFPQRSFRALASGHAAALLIAGEYLLRATAPGHHPSVVRVVVSAGGDVLASLNLPRADRAAVDGVLVPGGPTPLGAEVDTFSMGRTEVTNEQYLAFVSAGGYRDTLLWPKALRLEDGTVRQAEGVLRFVDRTGLPGPRNWEGGRFPVGRDRHPVTGVTWYEAAAYARWVGGELPTATEWWRAALGDTIQPYPWGSAGGSAHLRANLEGVDAAPVGTYLPGVSPFGALDMAGNVREWLGDPEGSDGRRISAGGSWQQPVYTASIQWMERFPPDHTGDGLGFRVLWRPGERKGAP